MCSSLSTMFPMVSPMFSEFSTIVPGCPTCFHPCFHTVPAFFPAIFPPFSHFYHVWNNSQGISLMFPPCFTTSFTTFHHGFHIFPTFSPCFHHFSNVCHVFTMCSPCFPPLPMDFYRLGHDHLVGLQDHVLRDAVASPVALDGRGREAQAEAHLDVALGPETGHTHIYKYIYI